MENGRATTTGTELERFMSTRSRGFGRRCSGFLRPFRGVHKKHLAGYVAICEFKVNLKRVTPSFISALVRMHHF
jgi:transposase-like protein